MPVAAADRWPFLNVYERDMVEPIVALIERRFSDANPFERAAELYSRAEGKPVDELAFMAFYEHWYLIGATEDMILAACAVIVARRGTHAGRHNVCRAVSTVIRDFCARAAMERVK